MAYDVTKLPNYTSQKSEELMTKSILGGQTISILADKGSFNPSAKGSEAINLMSTDTFWQDGSTCGRNELGDTQLSQEVLTVKPIKINGKLCPRALEAKYTVEFMKAKYSGQNYDEALFIDKIGEEASLQIQADLEKAVWQGDTTISGTSNLKFFNGFLKQLAGKTDLIDINNDGASVLAKLQLAHAAMPVEVTGQEDFRIFIGKDVANQLLAIMAEKNLFHPNVADSLFGTDAKFEVVNGLNSTKKAVFARVRNLRAGGEIGETEMNHWYSQDSDEVKTNVRFSMGTAVIYSSEIGVLDLEAGATVVEGE